MIADEHRTSCPGFLDEYGIWNNGFECPPLSNQVRVCCGSESRRYCCTLTSWSTPNYRQHDKSFLANRNSSFFYQIQSNSFFLPMIIIFLSVLIIFIIFVLILFFIRYWTRRKQSKKTSDDQCSGKQTLLIDHFPFTPPHHQIFFNDSLTSTSILNSKSNEPFSNTTLTTLTPSTTGTSSTGSSSSACVPSELYFQDWKEFFVNSDQPMNLYPNNLPNRPSTYRLNAFCQQEDIIV